MAENESAGGVIVEISADVSSLITATRRATSELGAVGAAADGAGAHMGELETDVTRLARGVRNAGGGFGSLQRQLAGAGNQITDFFLMVTGGQGVLRALSTQANQLGMMFGPQGAIIGGVIGLAAMLAGMLFPNLDNTKEKLKAAQDAAKDLADVFQLTAEGAVVLSEKFMKLAAANEAAAHAQLIAAISQANIVIAQQQEAITKAIDAEFSWRASLDAAASQLERLKQKGGDWRATLDDLREGHEGAVAGVSMLNQAIDKIAADMGLTREQAKDLTEAMINWSQDKSVEHAEALRDVMAQLSEKYGYHNNKLNDLMNATLKEIETLSQSNEMRRDSEAALHGDTIATEENTKAKEENERALKSLIERTHEEAETAGMSARAKAIYKARQDGANEAQIEGINADYDKIEAAAKAKKAQQEHNREVKAGESAARKAANTQETIATKLENMRQKAELGTTATTELSRAQAVLAAQQSLGKAATSEQIALMGKYAGAVWDANNAEKQRAKDQQLAAQKAQASKAAGGYIASAAVTLGTDPAAAVKAENAAKQAALDQYRAKGLIDEALYQKATTALAQEGAYQREKILFEQAQNQREILAGGLNSVSDSFNALASIAASSAGKSSGAYQAMFALSKGFAIANATVSLYSAVMQAMADPSALTPAQKFANYAAVFTAGVGLLSQISSISMGTGKAAGGSVLGGSAYRVGEGNRPEIFKAGNGNQYMIPGDNGRVIPNSQVGGAGGMTVNFNIQTTGGIDDATMAKMAGMMRQVSLNTIKDQQRPNGLLQRSR